MSSENYHEPVEQLAAATVEHHRVIASLMEELEAIDWYQQRIDATADEELKRILAHNRDDEKEHAAMALEWLRRRDPKLDEELRTYLFTDTDIVVLEETDEAETDAASPSSDASLRIGSLRVREDEAHG